MALVNTWGTDPKAVGDDNKDRLRFLRAVLVGMLPKAYQDMVFAQCIFEKGSILEIGDVINKVLSRVGDRRTATILHAHFSFYFCFGF